MRLVYLAVLNLYKRRGHFLNAGIDDTGNEEKLPKLYQAFWNSLPEELELKFPESVDFEELEDILGNREYSLNENAEKLAVLFGMVKNRQKAEYELVENAVWAVRAGWYIFLEKIF